MRILFITCGSIGDAVLSTGLLAHLLERYAQAEFTIAAGPAAAPLFEAFPRLHRLIVIRKQKRKRHWLALWRNVRGTRWDLVVDLRGSILSFLLHAKHRRIFSFPDRKKTKIDQLGALFGLSPAPLPELWVSTEAMNRARELLDSKRIIVMIPISNSPFKDWPIERFAQLAVRLLHKPRCSASVIAVLGLEHQRAALGPLINSLPAAQCLDLIGKTDISLACAILQQAQLVIGNDSGLLHMAGALGAPLVGLYGPTNDIKYAPRGTHVRIAKVREFALADGEIPDPEIIKQLSIEQVENAVDEILEACQPTKIPAAFRL